jgi:hypothetical protein
VAGGTLKNDILTQKGKHKVTIPLKKIQSSHKHSLAASSCISLGCAKWNQVHQIIISHSLLSDDKATNHMTTNQMTISLESHDTMADNWVLSVGKEPEGTQYNITWQIGRLSRGLRGGWLLR